MNNIEDRVSILVCSCDSYSDLWYPFFKLYKKYWTIPELKVYLNTETKDYSFEGLDIKCIHPKDKKAPYGARMRNALSHIDTEYVITFLDDFFIREKVDDKHIRRIIQWMDEDKDIVCFNQDFLDVYCKWEENKYAGYCRIPSGNSYTLNMQAAIWRTKALKRYWMNNVSPWEWEEYCNALTYDRRKDKFYTTLSNDISFCKYGHKKLCDVWGVFHGKWVVDDVVPFFEKEGIEIDYSLRGDYNEIDDTPKIDNSRPHKYLVKTCLGKKYLIKYYIYCLKKKKFKKIRTTPKRMFYHYIEDLQNKAKEDFLNYYSSESKH